MTFSTLLPPCVARFNIHKALYEIRIENKGDLPSEKSISRNALSAMISAIFVVSYVIPVCHTFVFCLHLSQNITVETLSYQGMLTIKICCFS